MDYLYIDIRPAEDKDIPAILELEGLCFKSGTWKRENVLYEMHENPVSNFWVLELSHTGKDEDKRIVGFSDYWVTFDSATIAQIAIHPTFRRNHLASALMKDIIDDWYAKKVIYLTLEVRASNEKAIALYIKNGFKKEVIKPHYYDDGEDAIYMIRKVED